MSDKFCINISGGRKINLELYPSDAPISVENFRSLAAQGFYNGLCFHRVIPNFMIQGGGFSIDKDGGLSQKNAATIRGEFLSNNVSNGIKHTAGTISMARTNVKDSASSQFFICAADCAYLDGEYAAFGRVIDEASMHVVKEISEVKTGKWMYYDDVPVTPVIIEGIEEL